MCTRMYTCRYMFLPYHSAVSVICNPIEVSSITNIQYPISTMDIVTIIQALGIFLHIFLCIFLHTNSWYNSWYEFLAHCILYPPSQERGSCLPVAGIQDFLCKMLLSPTPHAPPQEDDVSYLTFALESATPTSCGPQRNTVQQGFPCPRRFRLQ